MRRSTKLFPAIIVLGGLLAAGFVDPAAGEDKRDFAGDPLVGAWMVQTPGGPAMAVFSADGTVVQGIPTTQAGPGGLTYVSAEVGTWEPTGDRTNHFTAVQLLSDASGVFTGTVTIDAYQVVSEDGLTFTSTEGTNVTIRDAANNILQVIAGNDPPAVGTRMSVGSPGLSEPSAAASAAP
jgi:hypothetical protein